MKIPAQKRPVSHQFHQTTSSLTVRLTSCAARLADCPLKGGLAGGALRGSLLLCHLSPASAG
ncbi:hypothetical protein [Escherichia coli]|uniref:hypothetical protein n=1 Tax=Escherichia coli TaxID=562 RepID=UPI000BE83448|nr:hypothetical protein [Escherichia coli]EFK1902807.1 hypothetical protein [Escherichia coli]EFO1447776.1 hypothetical protein [Escherichia coli]EIF8301273.1 hypothetical protein [Escherichia coli]EJD3144409.1 hypothetical protein [Escherichia coli]EJH1088758.1 hypothetical protein [Escherichia coli]